MRRSRTFEAARQLHRRRGRSLIVASVAASVCGVALSVTAASVWGADRRDAAEARFRDVVTAEHASVEQTVSEYRRMLTVAQGFLSIREPTAKGFERFARSLQLSRAHPSVVALQVIERRAGRASGDIMYPVTMVAPATAAPTLLGFNLAADPSARDALEQVGRDGGVTMTPPKENTYRQPRMQLVAPVHRDGAFVGWVGATLDPTVLATEMLGAPSPGVIATIQWDADGRVLGTALGEHADPSEPALFRSDAPLLAEGSPWTVTVTAVHAFDPQAAGFAWGPFVTGLVATAALSTILLLLGRSRMAALDLATQLGLDLAASEARAKAVMDSAVGLRCWRCPRGACNSETAGLRRGLRSRPVLANLFLHYAFDAWMAREHPAVRFERYADDGVPRTLKEGRCRRRYRRMRCCTRDEGAGLCGLVALRGRPAGGGRKPPRGAPVKSRGAERRGEGVLSARQVWITKASESEPPLRCRKRICDVLKPGVESLPREEPGGSLLIGQVGVRHGWWRERDLGSCAELGDLSPRLDGLLVERFGPAAGCLEREPQAADL